MNTEHTDDSMHRNSRLAASRPFLVGAVGTLAVLAGWSLMRGAQKNRRYADRAPDRRQPMSLFTPGMYLRRREIDRSGTHPLFERRQSVYEAY